MGGAGNLVPKLFEGKANFGDAVRIGLDAATSGVAELGYAANRTNEGLATPAKTLADNMGQQQQQQREAADKAGTLALQAPKNITPDNFLSMKAKQLAALRLGIGPTVTGAGGADAGALGPTLLKAGDMTKLKTKLGQ